MVRVPSVLTVEQVDCLIGAGSDLFEQTVPSVLFSSGALLTELVSFRLLDVEWKVEESRSGYIRFHPEANPARVAPLNPKALELLRSYIVWKPSQKGWLFENAGGSRYKAREILGLLNRLAGRAKLGEVKATTLRDAMAVHFLERGGSPLVLDQILGPAPLGEAGRYARMKLVYEE